MSSSSRLYGEPFISMRESIAWESSASPFEDSDVLVLSSRSTSSGGVGATLFYLDLRLSLPLRRASEVNWGFAGLRHTLSTSPLRFRWTHSSIDSRDDGLSDEGEVIQRDGVDIETGIGLNPATGQTECYEETWRDEPLPAGSPYIFISSNANVEDATAAMAVLGPHALALARESEGQNASPKSRAVRLHQRMNAAHESLWDIVFSTGCPMQEHELKELVGLADQVSQYARGSNICLGSRSWVVWDSGRKGMREIGSEPVVSNNITIS